MEWNAGILLCGAGLVAGWGGVAIAAQDAGIPTLHVYETLIQIPVLVLDPLGAPLEPIDPRRFAISIDSGPRFRPTYVRLEGDDPISLSILLDARGPVGLSGTRRHADRNLRCGVRYCHNSARSRPYLRLAQLHLRHPLLALERHHRPHGWTGPLGSCKQLHHLQRRQRKCFDCGYTVDADDPCCSAPLDDEPEEDEEEEEDSSPALNTEDVALRHLSAALDIVYGLNPRKEGR